MAVQRMPGHLGSLTPEEDYKLREVTLGFMIYFGDAPPDAKVGGNAPEFEKKTGGRLGFGGRKVVESGTENLSEVVKAIKETFSGRETHKLKRALQKMIQCDHPDQLFLRFLRARKWDTVKSAEMLGQTLIWRVEEFDIDSIMSRGEQYYIDVEPDEGFINQFKRGKVVLHGKDKQGRPIVTIRVRFHDPKAQSEEAMERLTVLVIETARLCLNDYIETAVVIFDMTGFGLGNMDYHVVRFLIKCFEAHYPECLGYLFIHRAPWVFSTIWNVIKGWIDPVVASKISFTKTEKDLLKFINSDSLAKELGGTRSWEYEWEPPYQGENDRLEEHDVRDKLIDEQVKMFEEADKINLSLITSKDSSERDKYREERNKVIKRIRDQYYRIDPYIRSRTIIDRDGSLAEFKDEFKPGGSAGPILKKS